MYMLRFRLQAWYLSSMRKLQHWMFSWRIDDDSDLVLVIFGFINIVKYKESALVSFGRKNFRAAPKHLGISEKVGFESVFVQGEKR